MFTLSLCQKSERNGAQLINTLFYLIIDCTSVDLRVWRTNPGSVFDYDPAEDNIQSRSLHMMSGEIKIKGDR